MASSPISSHPSLYPTGTADSYPDPSPGENPFRDPPIIQHDQKSYSSDFVAALPAQKTTTTIDANSSTQHAPTSPFPPSPESSILVEATPPHRGRRYIFAALVVAFYACTIILTAAIVVMVRNATGSTNGRLRATGVIMGLVGGAGVLTSGLAAWKVWRKERRLKAMSSQEQMEIELELRGLVTKNEPLAFTPAVGLEPDLDLAEVPLPLFDGGSKRGSKMGGGDLGCTGRTTIRASGTHDNIFHPNTGVENRISRTDISEDQKRQGSNFNQRASSPRSSSSTFPSQNIIAPTFLLTSDIKSQSQNNKLRPPPADQDQNQHQTFRPTPTPPGTTIRPINETAPANSSAAWTPNLFSSISLSSSISSSSLSLPLQNPSSQNQHQHQDLSLLRALAADMGSEDESTRQTKRKRGLEAARNWGAVDDEEREEGAAGAGKALEGRAEMECETEIEHEHGKGKGKANANASANGKRWGRVWGRKRKYT